MGQAPEATDIDNRPEGAFTDGEVEAYANQAISIFEDEYNVDVIVARIMGSYARNSASETSDIDVGVVFSQRPVQYMSPSTYRDEYQRHHMLGDNVDVIAWNVKRFAEYIYSNDPTILEFLGDENLYIDDSLEQRMEFLENCVAEQFDRSRLFHHYISMARANYEKYVGEIENRVKDGNRKNVPESSTVKRQTNIVRACLAAEHIRQEDELPPRDVGQLLTTTEHRDPSLVDDTFFGELIRMKRDGKSHQQCEDFALEAIKRIALEDGTGKGENNDWPDYEEGSGDMSAVEGDISRLIGAVAAMYS